MGGNQSMSMDTITKVLNQNILNALKQTKISTNSSNYINSTTTVIFGPQSYTKNCNIQTTFSVKNDQTTAAIIQMQDSTELQNMMETSFKQALASNQKAVNDFLSTTFQNQDTSIKTSSDLENIFQQNLKTSNLNDLTSVSTTLAGGRYEFNGTIICSPGQGINIDQTVIANQYVSQTSSAMLSILSQNQQLADLIQKLKSQQSSQNKGISSVLTALGIFILIPLAIIALFFFLNSKGKSLKDSKESAAAALVPGVKNEFYFF